jgi:hypothetical protein
MMAMVVAWSRGQQTVVLAAEHWVVSFEERVAFAVLVQA